MIARHALMVLGVAIATASCGPAPTVKQVSAATDKNARAYFDKVAAHVDRFRQKPPAGEGRIVVMVRVARDGQVQEVEVRQSSGSAPLDDAEVDAIWRASPLPPLPPELVGNPVTLIMPITYKIGR
jgi:protein TonB